MQKSAMRRWFQIKEQAAGKKRLRLSWFLYKIFGKNILYMIAFLVSLFTFAFAPKIREYSKKYFTLIESQTGLRPSLINQFKHIYSYANSLVDKMLALSGNYSEKHLVFSSKEDKKLLFDDITKGKGVFFICTHIGNIEMLQAFCLNTPTKPDFNINIFMSNQQSRIFNEFLQTVKIDFPAKIFQVEEINLNTGVELQENLNNGDVVFIAGDRLAQNNDTRLINVELFSHKAELPQGVFKLAKLMNVPTYFISAIKNDDKYQIILKKQNNLAEKELAGAYAKFMEQAIKINPFQFFHFYDFFD